MESGANFWAIVIIGFFFLGLLKACFDKTPPNKTISGRWGTKAGKFLSGNWGGKDWGEDTDESNRRDRGT